MAKNRFSVTYDIITPESAAQGDTAEDGFIAENVGLREAIEDVGGVCYEHNGNYEWFTNHEYDTNYRTGALERRALHPPDGTSRASRVRIARLLGVKEPRT
jgi:hypothetical protein